ncbi:MAG: beta-propeller fold lactonase family protein [Sinobacteraceae bacterium]|nr:beta-propeller fold lactonase family protein [Nevskiaceae bacterium]
MATPTVTSSGANPAALTVHPTNNYAYTADFGTLTSTPTTPSTISQYKIGSDGSLTPMTTASVAAGIGPSWLTTDPAGKYLYVVNLGDNTIGQYNISATDGSLSPMTTATVSTGANTKPFSIVVDPTGSYAYVANNNTNTIGQYTIAAAGSATPGALTAMTPATVAAGSGVLSVTIDPAGKYLYATNRAGNTVSQYTIGTGGALTPMTNATVATGVQPTSLATGY